MELVMEEFTTERIRYEKAKKTAKNIRNFYINLTCYCVVIPILIFVNLKYVPEFQWFWFSMLGWGIGLFAHAMEAFQFNPFFSKEWEDRKLKQFIDEEKLRKNQFKNQSKYK